MKRCLIYVFLVALVFAAPVKRVDVGKLQPVEAVGVYRENNLVILQTDTGDIGRGHDAIQALKDLKETASAIIYLDTATYLLVAEDAQNDAEKLKNELKGSVKICLIQEGVDIKEAVKYLSVHGDLPEFKKWKSGDTIPVLTEEKIVEKS